MFINRNFFLIWAGKLVSQIGDKFYSIAMAWWILKKTNSPSVMGLFLAVSVLPGLLTGLIAGAYVDRLNKKLLIVLSDIVRGFIVLGVALLSFFELAKVWHVFLAAVTISIASAFFDPAIQAIIPDIVGKKSVAKANARIQMIGGFTMVFGPVLGAAAVSVIGFSWIFLINAFSYLISAFSELFIKTGVTPLNKIKANIFDDIKAGIKYLASNRKTRTIISVIGMTHLFVGAFTVSMPFLANKLAGTGVKNLGFLETALGVGLLLGALIIGSMKNTNLRLQSLNLLIFLMGLSFLVIGILLLINKSVIPYTLTAFFIGLLIMSTSIFWQTMLQTDTPENLRGRVFGISTLVGNASLPVAYTVFGIMLDHFPVQINFFISGSMLCLFSIILLTMHDWTPLESK
jgi:MFS family permease